MDWRDLVPGSRLEEMRSAVGLLRQWQEMSFRKPILENPDAFYQEKDRIAALLVDNYLGKLARKVRTLGQDTSLDSREFLDEWAEIAFMSSLWCGFDDLGDGMKLNLIYQSGPNITRKHLDREQPLQDHFIVTGLDFAREESLLRRSVYLYGLTGQRYFMILDYAFNQQPFDQEYELGGMYQGQVVAYPFPGSLRVTAVDLQRDRLARGQLDAIPVLQIDEAVKTFYDALRVNPFCAPFPSMVELQSDFAEKKWQVWDGTGKEVRMSGMEEKEKALFYSICFRRPVRFMVLLSREGLRPVSYYNGEEFLGLLSRPSH